MKNEANATDLLNAAQISSNDLDLTTHLLNAVRIVLALTSKSDKEKAEMIKFILAN